MIFAQKLFISSRGEGAREPNGLCIQRPLAVSRICGGPFLTLLCAKKVFSGGHWKFLFGPRDRDSPRDFFSSGSGVPGENRVKRGSSHRHPKIYFVKTHPGPGNRALGPVFVPVSVPVFLPVFIPVGQRNPGARTGFWTGIWTGFRTGWGAQK